MRAMHVSWALGGPSWVLVTAPVVVKVMHCLTRPMSQPSGATVGPGSFIAFPLHWRRGQHS